MPTIDCIGEKRNMSMSLRHSPSSTLIYHREGVSTTLTQRAIGTYNPDWAIVFKGEKKIYFVAETKGEGQELRLSEQMKIACGKVHFEQFDDIEFKGPISSVSELNA